MLINIYKYYIGRGKGSLPPLTQPDGAASTVCLFALTFLHTVNI